MVNQINGTYANAWYDACAVMIRRLIETLIIEVFEQHGIANKIKTPTGDFFYLSELIPRTLSEGKWNLGRNAKKALPRLKSVGDRSAHNRRFNATHDDIDKPAAAKASTLQSSLRQLSKVAELLLRSASIAPSDLEVLESAIADVRKYTPVAPEKSKAK